ncbi:branched-chain amino acid ABC transporter permease [Thermaerobacter sp. FW80]|uniref:AzlC family ABC transporter permease n=1 Tax=Thermaerobacter sp. FW80 TaxID=2546351 RepID=UPI000DB07DFF|nr:AzlC family ABC transporter permease [Thermaerobacter sp. FW80]PZN04456.1 MAG: branched-chain amino acid ABC transporter permease [Bacillota bacterium]QBS38113.1 branched-chain amino acid ABC transporter permease [Thermaerobacter sp. FW80]
MERGAERSEGRPGAWCALRRPAWAEAEATRAFARGLWAGLPIVAGYLPIGLAFGVVAVQAGLTPAEALAMSLVVFAGSAQFAAAGMVAAGAAPAALVATTFLINLRHVLFGAALAPRLGERRWGRLAVAAFGLTDEVFAVAQATLDRVPRPWPYLMGLEVAAYGSWCAASWLGAAIGGALEGLGAWGLDYALPAMFLALIALQLGDRAGRGLVVAAVAAGVSLAVGALGWTHWRVLAAALVGSAVGVGMERCASRCSGPSS